MNSGRRRLEEEVTISAPSDNLRPGATLDGRYQIVRLLGEGGFGAVFEAVQKSTGQKVAVKVLHVQKGYVDAAARDHAERFDREMQVIAQLRHPNIVRLLDSGRMPDGASYAVLEYVAGRPLSDVIEEEGPLTIAEAGRLMGQVMDALSCAHALGVVHRPPDRNDRQLGLPLGQQTFSGRGVSGLDRIIILTLIVIDKKRIQSVDCPYGK